MGDPRDREISRTSCGSSRDGPSCPGLGRSRNIQARPASESKNAILCPSSGYLSYSSSVIRQDSHPTNRSAVIGIHRCFFGSAPTPGGAGATASATRYIAPILAFATPLPYHPTRP